MKRILLFAFTLTLLSLPAFAHVKEEDKTCQTDADCAVIPISCNSCCPTFDMAEVAAVNKDKAQSYAELGKCTAEHIRNCGVPECGLMPTPYPAATCMNGVCTTFMHEAPSHEPPPEAPKQ
jgi:hypothetical protein